MDCSRDTQVRSHCAKTCETVELYCIYAELEHGVLQRAIQQIEIIYRTLIGKRV